MDLVTATAALERAGFEVTFRIHPEDSALSEHVAVRREGWFAARVCLPVAMGVKPRTYIGVCANREPDGFVFWTRSHYATPTRYLAIQTAALFVRTVRLRW